MSNKNNSNIKIPQDRLSEQLKVYLEKINNLIYSVLEDLFIGSTDMTYEIELDLFESDGILIMEAILPGVQTRDIFLRLEPELLTIQGEILASEDFEENSVFISERFYGPFHRVIKLPFIVDPERTEAFYRDGILRVEMVISDEEDKNFYYPKPVKNIHIS